MKIATVLNALAETLRPRLVEAGGELHVASTVEHTLEILSNAPGRWRCVLQFNGDEAPSEGRGSFAQCEISAIVQAHGGLPAQHGLHTRQPQAHQDSFLGHVEYVRTLLRGVVWSQGAPPHPADPPPVQTPEGLDHFGLRYTGATWLDLTELGLPTRQMQLRFSFGMALDPPVILPVPFP